jgi:amino acid permease
MDLGANIPNIILATLMLILVVLGIAALFVGFFWLVYRIGTIFYRWLSQRGFFVRLRQKRQDWWDRHKVSAAWWWESTAIVFIDPVFYGYVLVTLVQRLQAIQEYAQHYPQYSFWQLLDLDTTTHMQYYIALAVIFVLWMAWKVQRHSQEVRFERNVNAKLDKLLDGIGNSNKELSESIKQNSKDIKKLTASIKRLTKEIRKDKEDKHGK